MVETYKQGIVRVLQQNNVSTAGTGFVLSAAGLICTCSHVIQGEAAQAAGQPRQQEWQVEFLQGRQVVAARLEESLWRGVHEGDIAFLRLDGPLPQGVTPLRLGAAGDLRGETVYSYGFPPDRPVDGLAARCEVIGTTTDHGQERWTVESRQLDHGYSGAPVCDRDDWVLGMVVSRRSDDRAGRNIDTAFLIPSEAIAAVCGIAVHPRPPAAPAALTHLHQIPPPPADFVGREQEIAKLLAAMRSGAGAAIAGLRGMGGVGKTALAYLFAARLRDDYPDAQLLVDMQGTSARPTTPEEALAQVIRAYHPAARLPDALGELRALYLSLLDGKKALLLLDNAAEAAQVAPLLPPPGCALIFTSRAAIPVRGALQLNLEALRPAEAADLLCRLVGAARGEDLCQEAGNRAALHEIAQLCGYLPLALCAAGSLLAVTEDLTPAEYAGALRDESARLDKIGEEGVEIGVAASLGLSYARLSEAGQRVFRQLAVFPASWDASAEEAICQDPGHQELSGLVRLSLVNYAEGRYRLHDLARLYAQKQQRHGMPGQGRPERHGMPGEGEGLALRHAEYYAEVARAAKELYKQGGERVVEGLALFDREWANIRAGHHWAAQAETADDAAARLASDYPDAAVYFLLLRLHPREWIRWLEEAVAAARRLGDRGAEGNHLGNLGGAYWSLGEARRTIEYYEQQLVIAREIGDRRGEGNALSGLGLAYVDLGDFRRAVEFYEQALALDREIGDRRGEGAVLGNLGLAYQNLGDFRRAIGYHEQALALDRETGDRHGEGADLGNLGNAYLSLGDALPGGARRAIEFYEQALAIRREIGDRRGEGADLGNLGVAYKSLGDLGRAIEYYEQQLAIAREIGDRRGEGNVLWNMALALDGLGRREEALPLAEQALAIYEQIEAPPAEKVRRRLQAWRAGAA